MPRKGVPYGGTICSLKERIAEIWDKLGEKLRSINGVQGDGQGNVQIESGDDAVVITNDQIGHKIKVSLDDSKLPAAAVSSVNGETGAVVLNAGNIPTKGNANVQTDIDVGKAGLQNCIANIITEREARENGDAALQANINALHGAVEADYVKKSGAAQQTVTSQIMVPTTATGSRDAQIANGTRIQNDLDNYAAMIRTTGAQRKKGLLTLDDGIVAIPAGWHSISKSGQHIGEYCIFAKVEGRWDGRYEVIDFLQSSNTATAYGRMVFRSFRNGPNPVWAIRKSRGPNNPLSAASIVILSDGTDLYIAWKKEVTYGKVSARLVADVSYGNIPAKSNITWYDPDDRIIVTDLSAYTVYDVVE